MRPLLQSLTAYAMKRLVVITLATLAALGGVAMALEALRAAATSQTLALSVTPAKQTVARGATVSFSVEPRISSGRTRLRVRRLPRGVRAQWRLADGGRSRSLQADQPGAVLTLRVSRRVRLGLHRLKVVASRGKARVTRMLRVTVVRPSSDRFSLRIGPARQTLAQGSIATYRVRIKRRPGFRRRVRLRAMVRPRGALADVRVIGRRIFVSATAGSPRAALLIVRGTSGGKRRYAIAALKLVESEEFQIDGDLATTLYPGMEGALDLELTNPHSFPISVTALDVAIRPETTEPECNGEENYGVQQYSGGYPLVLPPGTTTLSSLTSAAEELPHVAMPNLPRSQDACQGAELTLDYAGEATR